MVGEITGKQPRQPQWFESLVSSWDTPDRAMVIKRCADSKKAMPALQLTLRMQVSLDLSLIPAGEALEVIVQDAPHRTAATMRLSGLQKDATCRLVRSIEAASRVSAGLVTLADSVVGSVQIANPTANVLQVGAEPGCAADLHLVQGAITLDADLPETVEITLESGQLHLVAPRRDLTLSGRATILAEQNATKPRIDNLYVKGASILEMAGRGNGPTDQLAGHGADAVLTLHGAGRETTSAWTVAGIAHLRIEANTQLTINGVQRLAEAKICGPVTLMFNQSSTADSLRLTANAHGEPTIVAGAGSMLDGLSGSAHLGLVQGSSLAGGPNSFAIASVASTGLERCVLTGFTLPRGLAGRQLLSEMEQTYHINPHTADLPGWDQRWQARRHRLAAEPHEQSPPVEGSHAVDAASGGHVSGKQGTSEHVRRLHHDAEFMRELQRLVIEKGAPGSTRTKVAWCAYRLRHKTTSGRVERLALGVYRLLGYGERPMPAFVTWLVLAVGAAALVLGGPPDLSPEGAGRLAEEALRQATGPLAGLLQGGTASLDHPWHYLIRGVVAVPLVTGALALRNYVKAGRG